MEKRCEVKSSSIFVHLFRWIILIAIGGFIASYFFDKPNFEYSYSFWKHSIALGDKNYWNVLITCTIISKIVGIIIASFQNEEDTTYIQYAENEAEERYQEDLDRWHHYLDAEDEIADRQLAREIKRMRASGQVSLEQLVDMYGKLSAIQNQTNQSACLIHQEAQRALHNGRRNDTENALDQLEKVFGVFGV